MLSVSAVIPTYNGSRYLAASVRSALEQSHDLLEIIVIDDGSRDDIQGILAPFPSKVRYVRQENGGPAAARNRGVSMARGDLIAFLDDDDLWHPTKTAEQVRVLAENPRCGMVYSYPELIDEHGAVIPNEAPSEFPCGEVYLAFLHRNRITTPSATMIRREVFRCVGGFDENREYICGEDYDLWLRIARRYQVMFCPGTVTSYRVRSAGISKNLPNALKGHRYLLRKAAELHASDPVVKDAEFHAALNANLYRCLRGYAYGYHYALNDRAMAKRLITEALGLFPHCLEHFFKDVGYLFLFALPDNMFRLLRKAKGALS